MAPFWRRVPREGGLGRLLNMSQTGLGQSEVLQQILRDGLSLDQERSAIEACVRNNPALTMSLLHTLVTQKHRCRMLLQQTQANHADLLKTLEEPPWVAAAFLRFAAEGDRALVAVGNRRSVVPLRPGVEGARLRMGTPVFLNAAQNAIVGIAEELLQPGVVGEFSRLCGPTRGVVRGPAGEEIVVDLAEGLLDAGLAAGELVLYDRDMYVAYDKVERNQHGARLLEDLTLDFTRERLGGLDQIFDELTAEITLHLAHPELVDRFHLQPTRGVLLCGPPGTGKTSLVRALGEYLHRTLQVDVKALLVRPGVHRSKWFGASEQLVRDLFHEAADATRHGDCYVLLFFDDVDHLGSRDHRIAGEVDARLLPCFLQEIDSLRCPRLMLVGATNREDLLDEALLRPGRFGRIFRTARPDRRQAREIVRRLLPADLPLGGNGNGSGASDEDVIEKLLAAVYAPNGEMSTLATLTFRDGSRRPLLAAHVMSGAVIAAAIDRAKRSGCTRALNGGPVVIDANDLHSAIARELTSIAERLKPGPSLNQMLGLPPDQDVVRIELRRRGADALSTEHLGHSREQESLIWRE